MKKRKDRTQDMWNVHGARWRSPSHVVSHWEEAGNAPEQGLLEARARGAWWEILESLQITLLVTREYEHTAVGLSARDGKPRTTYMRMPHPSGIAVNRKTGAVHIACTRNPNQVMEFAPLSNVLDRKDVNTPSPGDRPLMPAGTRFYPGSLYLHDLAVINGELYGNAVAHNCIVKLPAAGGFERVWWPRCIESDAGPEFRVNYLQLNSIAAGKDIESSFFTASTDKVSSRRPGHRNFPVDGRGVVFSGKTRESAASGLTRPHSARLYRGGLWLDNSGYGELVRVRGGSFEPVVRLPGWTRGLCFCKGYAFVGTSRVIPGFEQYAPGLDPSKSMCAVHAVELKTGKVRGYLEWPIGNQVFSTEWISVLKCTGFPFRAGSKDERKKLFYSYEI